MFSKSQIMKEVHKRTRLQMRSRPLTLKETICNELRGREDLEDISSRSAFSFFEILFRSNNRGSYDVTGDQ